MRRRHLLGAATFALLWTGCPSQRRVVLRFAGEPGDALVTINDRYVGKLGRLASSGVRLEPGSYRITIEQVGYFPHDELVEVGEERPVVVQVKLVPVPD